MDAKMNMKKCDRRAVAVVLMIAQCQIYGYLLINLYELFVDFLFGGIYVFIFIYDVFSSFFSISFYLFSTFLLFSFDNLMMLIMMLEIREKEDGKK